MRFNTVFFGKTHMSTPIPFRRQNRIQLSEKVQNGIVIGQATTKHTDQTCESVWNVPIQRIGASSLVPVIRYPAYPNQQAANGDHLGTLPFVPDAEHSI